MKVWLVRIPDDPYEPWDVLGVFSTKEKAEKYWEKLIVEKNYGGEDHSIEEWEIDNPKF